MEKEERRPIGSDASFFSAIAIGIIATVIFFQFQQNTLNMATSHFQLVVAVGGVLGLLARWISDSARNRLVSKLAEFLMNIACTSIGVVFAMLYYIAKG